MRKSNAASTHESSRSRDSRLQPRAAGLTQWGKGIKPVRLPSGRPLRFDTIGQNAMLQFMGIKDISHRVIDKETGTVKDAGTVIYLVFNDGRRIVTHTRGFAFEEATTELEDKDGNRIPAAIQPGDYLFVELVDYIDTNQPTPMKDFAIFRLGVEGEKIDVPEEYAGLLGSTFEVSLKAIAKANYEKLDYPFRQV